MDGDDSDDDSDGNAGKQHERDKHEKPKEEGKRKKSKKSKKAKKAGLVDLEAAQARYRLLAGLAVPAPPPKTQQSKATSPPPSQLTLGTLSSAFGNRRSTNQPTSSTSSTNTGSGGAAPHLPMGTVARNKADNGSLFKVYEERRYNPATRRYGTGGAGGGSGAEAEGGSGGRGTLKAKAEGGRGAPLSPPESSSFASTEADQGLAWVEPGDDDMVAQEPKHRTPFAKR